jgi:hypothetical protein
MHRHATHPWGLHMHFCIFTNTNLYIIDCISFYSLLFLTLITRARRWWMRRFFPSGEDDISQIVSRKFRFCRRASGRRWKCKISYLVLIWLGNLQRWFFTEGWSSATCVLGHKILGCLWDDDNRSTVGPSVRGIETGVSTTPAPLHSTFYRITKRTQSIGPQVGARGSGVELETDCCNFDVWILNSDKNNDHLDYKFVRFSYEGRFLCYPHSYEGKELGEK